MRKRAAAVAALLIPAAVWWMLPKAERLPEPTFPLISSGAAVWRVERIGPPTLQEFLAMPNPTVPQGGSNTFPYASASGGYSTTWTVYSPAAAALATGSTFPGSNNGWTVDYNSPNFTVTAPSGQTIATDYSVSAEKSGESASAFFDVVAGGGGSSSQAMMMWARRR